MKRTDARLFGLADAVPPDSTNYAPSATGARSKRGVVPEADSSMSFFSQTANLPADVAARFQASTIERARVAEEVPRRLCDWERVRLLHLHGGLEYEFYSDAADLALFSFEGARSRRFVDSTAVSGSEWWCRLRGGR